LSNVLKEIFSDLHKVFATRRSITFVPNVERM
jgi:hypothetical protein